MKTCRNKIEEIIAEIDRLSCASQIRILYLATAILIFYISGLPSLDLRSHLIFVELSLTPITNTDFQPNKVSGYLNVSLTVFFLIIINDQRACWPYLLPQLHDCAMAAAKTTLTLTQGTNMCTHFVKKNAYLCAMWGQSSSNDSREGGGCSCHGK